MRLEIKPLSQRDSLWKDKKLGTSTTALIKDYGCLLVCHAMMLTYYGHDFHPDDLNEFYKTRKVFDQATMINFWAAANCFEDINTDEYYDCYDIPCDLTKIDTCLGRGIPVICMVDFSPTAGVQSHFVLIVGKDQDYLINDPWTGETYWFTAKYGDPTTKIFGLRLYSGPVKEVVSVESLNAKVAELYQQVSDANKALASLQDTVGKLQAEIKGYEEDAENLQEENRNLVLADEKQKIEINELERGMETLVEDKKAVLEDLVNLKKLTIDSFSSTELIVKGFIKLFKRG